MAALLGGDAGAQHCVRISGLLETEKNLGRNVGPENVVGGVDVDVTNVIALDHEDGLAQESQMQLYLAA